MNVRELKKIINLMKDSDISEIEFEKEGEKVRIVRNSLSGEVYRTILSSIPHMSSHFPPQSINLAPQGGLVTRNGEDKKDSTADNDKFVKITSPMVGTFYVAPGPDSPAYVRLGDIVKKGDVLCVVEAMKLMNEIESDTDGKVVSVLVENAQPIEYGQPLFLIDPQ